MILGGISSREVSGDAIRAKLGDAKAVARVDDYRSESLVITRIATLTAGTYFVVVESDVMLPEDITALEVLSTELRRPWRSCVLDTDIWGRPHRELPLSSTFSVHVVHPACPEGKPNRRILV